MCALICVDAADNRGEIMAECGGMYSIQRVMLSRFRFPSSFGDRSGMDLQDYLQYGNRDHGWQSVIILLMI